MPLTMDDIKKLPPKQKAALLGGGLLLIGAAWWFYLLGPTLEKRGELQKKLAEVEQTVAEKERLAGQKQRFLKEVALLKEALALALTKLPDQREIPGLFQAVSLAGREAGMEFLLFEPKPPEAPKPSGPPDVKANLKPSDQRAEAGPPKPGAAPPKPGEPDRFYEAIPVKVVVTGGFTSAVSFFDKVSKLPRIINIEDITMGEGKDNALKQRVINTSCTIKTYMFLDKKTEGAPKK